MKILLIGEYNRTHFNIKKGLEHFGHHAKVISNSDGFKKVNVDYEILEDKHKTFLDLLYKLKLGFIAKRIVSISVLRQIKKLKKQLSNYDIIQFVNEAPFNVTLKSQIKIFKWLQKWNKNARFYLLSCGLDHISIDYAFKKKFRYSILTPYFENKVDKKDHSIGLRYLSDKYIKLHKFVFSNITGVISNDLDYHLPLLNHPKYLGMIPHAIDVEKLNYIQPKVSDKIIIFHGINTFNYYKKGNDIFDEALKIIEEKYTDSIEIDTVKNLSYEEYINRFNRCHILLDQVYAYDQGFNALDAMAKGKVVFTGAEKEWLDYYDLKEDTVAINALPNTHAIAEKLEWLILNPEKIEEISLNARSFVKEHHDHIKCATQYINKWSTSWETSTLKKS